MESSHPTSLESAAESQQAQDHLKLLGVFYILFGLAALPGLLVLGMSEMFVPDIQAALNQANVSLDVAQFLRTAQLAIALFIIVHVIVFLWIGLCFRKQKHYNLCFVAAIFACLSFPLGTILGVFSLVVLTKPVAKALFR